MHSTRRTFIQSTLVLTVGAAALAACEDDSGGTPNGQDGGTPAALTATINGNHGHVLVVTAADLSEGVEKSYNIAGSAGHSHSVTVTAAQFATLRDDGAVTVQSTTSTGHSHSITVVS